MNIFVRTCNDCPMFASGCGQYEECFCQHPSNKINTGSDSWEWRNWDDERHPDCPLTHLGDITINPLQIRT